MNGTLTETNFDHRTDLEKTRHGKTDGRMFPVTEADLVRGAVLTMVESDGGTHSFADHVIVDVYETDSLGRRVEPGSKAPATRFRMVRLARPYAYVSSADTVCPTVLQGFEDYTVLASNLTGPESHFRVRVRSTGQTDTRVT